MAAVDWITIEGSKSIKRNTRLPLSPISVLIGPNGSGKSNFIGVFSLLREIRNGRLQEYVAKSGGADRMLHFGSKMTSALRAHVSLGSGVYEYTVTLAPTAADGLSPTRETCLEHQDGHPPWILSHTWNLPHPVTDRRPGSVEIRLVSTTGPCNASATISMAGACTTSTTGGRRRHSRRRRM